jgi:hypothetical protein
MLCRSTGVCLTAANDVLMNVDGIVHVQPLNGHHDAHKALQFKDKTL